MKVSISWKLKVLLFNNEFGKNGKLFKFQPQNEY